MQIYRYPKEVDWAKLTQRPEMNIRSVVPAVQSIMHGVKNEGDQAVLRFTEEFDGLRLSNLRVSDKTISTSQNEVVPPLKQAIGHAFDNIERFHKAQLTDYPELEIEPGVVCWQKDVPIDRVGLYIPGGTAPLFSSVLMLAIPARLAGCPNIYLCTPPDQNGTVHPAILYAARLCGVHEIFAVGGAQAIAALTYGTHSISRVDKIFGPGNRYVTAAKQLATLEGVAIDMPAGPSEVAVIADKQANADFIAADLLSQAEHGQDSQVLLVTDSPELIATVPIAVENQLKSLPRADIARQALENSRLLLMHNIEECVDIVNYYAPEHLIINMPDARQIAQKIRNAGSVFIGSLTPESSGDYASGTNHTLPTSGYARNYSGLNTRSFMKTITYQELSSEGINRLGPSIEVLAENEQLHAHKLAVTLRINAVKENKNEY
ncbi:MAG: histidinol dehydrogenase [Caldithrix sp.]|nr:histidinol dehydrogenase [Caldithrix sp.]